MLRPATGVPGRAQPAGPATAGVPVLLDVQHEQVRGHELLLHHRLADCKPFGTCVFTPQTCVGGTNNCTKPS